MKQLHVKYFFFSWLLALIFNNSLGQNSVLINVGSTNCATPNAPILSLIKNPLSDFPDVSTTCDMTAQLPDYFNVFVAYNPYDNKIYVNDTRNGSFSKVWKLDVGLPQDITCPTLIPTDPTLILNYSINNFEFDNGGNLWAIGDYDPITGQCVLGQYELTGGTLLASKTLQFPTDHFPTTISSGDLAILPNGRFFATLGNDPSQLYEITNYNGGAGNAVATYLQTIPSNTFGLAYLNGELEITGTNSLDSCYYFDYNISENILGEKKLFQSGQAPIDNTSISPVVGITKQLKNVTKVNDKTADISYEIYVQNMGNAILQNINIADDLAAAFGASNVSNVTTNFVAGYNVPGLILNSGYNGISDINLLNADQNLPNHTTTTENYLFKIAINCRVTNLKTDTIYNNSAIATGAIGSVQSLSIINVVDTSNNGPASKIDPNNNGNANESDENIPTPLDWKKILLPVNFINVNARLQNAGSAMIKWQIAIPVVNANKFEVEYSTDGVNWRTLSIIKITDKYQSFYQAMHTSIPSGNLFYRVKQIDEDGFYVYSKIIMLNNYSKNSVSVYPNPAKNYIKVDRGYNTNKNIEIELLNSVGQKLISKKITGGTAELQTTNLSNGTYLLKVIDNAQVATYKILIQH